MAVLKQAEVGVPVELIRQVGITEQTLGKLTHSSDKSRGPVATIRATCSEGGESSFCPVCPIRQTEHLQQRLNREALHQDREHYDTKGQIEQKASVWKRAL